MEKYILANWKMNNDFSDIQIFIDYIKSNDVSKENLVVCVPSVLLKYFAERSNGLIQTGAQNCYYKDKGAFTGEISPNMVKSSGATYTILGHSERRQIFGEDNFLINKKVTACLDLGLKVIFCIGETLEQKENYKEILKTEILEGLSGLSNLENLIIAYEPIWAIGTGKIATLEDIKEIHQFIKECVREKFNASVPVVYGGSVKPSNSKEILALDEVDGVLIGGASLKAEDYVKIAESRE